MKIPVLSDMSSILSKNGSIFSKIYANKNVRTYIDKNDRIKIFIIHSFITQNTSNRI